MNYAAYDALPGVRWSYLKEMRKSPLAYRHRKQTPMEDTPALRIGRALHAYMFEQGAFSDLFVTYRESKSVGAGAKTRWEAFKAANAHRTILSVDEYEAAVGMGLAVLSHPVSQYLDGGVNEHTVQWNDPDTGIGCKARIDHAGSHLVDIKSARSIEHRQFAAQAVSLGYIGQLAFYLDGCTANGMDLEPEPLLIAVESAKPHDVVPYRLTSDVIETGRREYKSLLGRYADCLESDSWPGIAPTDVVDLILPAWASGEYDDGLELVMPDGEKVAI